TYPLRALPSHDPRQDRTLPPFDEEHCEPAKLFSARTPGNGDCYFRELLQPPALPRVPGQPDPRRCLFWQSQGGAHKTRPSQETNLAAKALAEPATASSIILQTGKPHLSKLPPLSQMF